MNDPQTIWLQPWCRDCALNDTSDTGRTWCEDNPWDQCDCGAMPVKYVKAEDQPQPEAEEAEA